MFLKSDFKQKELDLLVFRFTLRKKTMGLYQTNWDCTMQQILAMLGLILLLDGASSETVFISEETQDRRIREEFTQCTKRLKTDAYPDNGDIYCDITWDGLECWGYTKAGTTASTSCPDYVNKFDPGARATRMCLPDGHWYEHPITNKSWTNYTACFQADNGSQTNVQNISDFVKYHMGNIRVMTDVGYGISLISLITAVTIMLGFRRLHCARNTIHVHLFFSFIFRSSMSLMKDNLLVEGLGFSSDVTYTATGNLLFLSNGPHWECKLFFTLFNYSLTVNYMWILVEGSYLHTLLYMVVFTENSSIVMFVVSGWALPLVSILPWVIVRAELEDKFCWNVHNNIGFFWILKGPIVLTIVINFVFFIRIVRVLFTKLVATNTQEARKFRYRKLAKSTLVLIPLFGVHYIIFLGLPEKSLNEVAEVTKLYFELFFNSFQGLFVATLFCFLNGEVKAEILKKWQRYQLRRNGGNLNFSHSMKMSTYSTYVQRPARNSPSGSQGEKAELTLQQHNGHSTTPPLLGGKSTNTYYSN